MTGRNVSATEMKRLAGDAREAAFHAAELLRDKTAPQIGAAIDWASPRAQAAWRKSVTAASPKVAEAAALLAPRIDGARDLLVQRALPAIVAAVDQAALNATAAAQPVKPKRTGRRFVLFTLLAAIAGGIGYWLWRQSRPMTDPWAEEDWQELDQAPEEHLQDAAHDAADAVGEAAGTAVKKVTQVAKKASDATRKAADTTKKAASDATKKATAATRKAAETTKKAASDATKKATQALSERGHIDDAAAEDNA